MMITSFFSIFVLSSLRHLLQGCVKALCSRTNSGIDPVAFVNALWSIHTYKEPTGCVCNENRTVSTLLLEASRCVPFVCVRRRSVIEAVYNKLNPHKEEEGVSWSLFKPPHPSAFQSTHPAPLSASSFSPVPTTWPHKHTAARARTLLYECEKRSERGRRLDGMTSDSSVGPPGRFQLSVELRRTVRTQRNSWCSFFMPREPLAQLN